MNTKNVIIAVLCMLSITMFGQTVEGSLTLNGKNKSTIELSSNSAVQLFKEFKTGKYQLGFNFKGNKLVNNLNKEQIVFFEFTTVVKKDGKLLKSLIHRQPMPYFPGEMSIPAEAFDFVGILATANGGKNIALTKYKTIGLMEPGTYTVELSAKPLEVGGKINALQFQFVVK